MREVFPPYTVSVDDCLKLPTCPFQTPLRHAQSQVEACHSEACARVPRSYETSSLQDPTVGLCLEGPVVVLGGWAFLMSEVPL